MGCLNVNISKLGSRIVPSISRIGDGIKALLTRVEEPMNAFATDIAEHLNVRCSIVCSLSEITDYLNVTPNDIQWITDDMGVFFDVESNVDWIIVTS